MNYIGYSATSDFVFCFVLGIAFAAIITIGFWAVHVVVARSYSVAFKNVLRVVIFLIGFCAQFAIATVIGNTKNVRDENSILGFVVGICVVIAIGYLFRKKRPGSGNGFE